MNLPSSPGTRPWIHVVLAAAALAMLVHLAGSSGAFLPPWMPTAAPLGGIWPPLLAVGVALLGVVLARSLLAGFWPHLGTRLPETLGRWIDPGRVEPGVCTPRIDRWDVLLALLLAAGEYSIVDLYRQFYNPESQCIGHDNYAFLSTAVAAATGRWDLYMLDKRPLYGVITALVSNGLMGGDTIRAAVAVNMAAVSLLPVPTYLIGRLWGGRAVGLGAGIMLLGVSLIYPFAHETASYPSYTLWTTTAILAVSWALLHPQRRSFLWAGLVMALVTLTQIKNFTFNLPLFGMLGLSLCFDGLGKRWVRGLLAAGPVAAAVAILSAYPVDMTPLNVLIMHHREEVNYEIPYTWEQIRKPDPAYPSPISAYLPDALRGGELEGVASTMLTPPDSDVMAAFPGDGPGRRWAHCPDTSIPPWSIRVGHNLKQAASLAPGVGPILFPLAGLGFLSVLLTPIAGAARRFGLPTGWWRAGVLLVPLASCMGSLSLKFNFRYVFHFMPATLVLVALAAVTFGRVALPHGALLWRGLGRAVAVALCGSMAIALYIRAPLIGSPLTAAVMEQAFFRLPPDARQLMGKGMMLVSDYVETHAPESAVIYDCTPIALSLYRPEDGRLVRPRNGSERDKICAAQLRTSPGAAPRMLVVTSIPEFFGPDVVTPQIVSRSEGWTLAYGYDIHGPRELGDPEDVARIGSGWIAVFTDTPESVPLAPSMLAGDDPGIPALEEGSPALPEQTPGAPELGNP